jgi:CRISPR-associated endonuclease/helicase Cas3
LHRRLSASKPATLVEPTALSFEKEAAARAAQALAGDVKIVGVVVNRVDSAREIFMRLPGEAFTDKVLLIGRIRPWDRDALLRRTLFRMAAGRARMPEDAPLFVVATMTVEVGADLDFDYLVTEAAPLAALRQRFGRLDRLGRFGKAAATILLRKAKGTDPIYGEELALTWRWLEQQGDVVDFGISALDARLQTAQPPPAARVRHAPVLFPAHLDALAQTSPAPEPSPDVAPFLHGADAFDAADVQIVWRADLVPGQEEDWLAIVAAAPPRSREALPVPIVAVRSWLQQDRPVAVADIEGLGGESLPKSGRPALRWYGPDTEYSRTVGPGEIQPGDTLVVPSSYGGADAFGWNSTGCEMVADVGDLCVNEMANVAPQDGNKRLIRIRLHPDAWEDFPENSRPILSAFFQRVCKEFAQGEAVDLTLATLLECLGDHPPQSALMTAVIHQLKKSGPRVMRYPSGILLSARVQPRFLPAKQGNESEAQNSTDDSTDADDSSSLRAGTLSAAPVELFQHLQGVDRWAKLLTQALRIAGDSSTLLGRAAALHDLGKSDPRFQFLLYGDEPGEALLAKSGRDLEPEKQDAVRRAANLPRGFRHEFVSVAFLQKYRDELLAGLDEAQRETVEYLVGTHHGRGRPFVPVIAEPHDAELAKVAWNGHSLAVSPAHQLWHLGSRWTELFWKMLRTNGYWGLAYLETVLRLADTACSAEEQKRGEP